MVRSPHVLHAELAPDGSQPATTTGQFDVEITEQVENNILERLRSMHFVSGAVQLWSAVRGREDA
jgi:hypothetical protein